VSFALSLHLNLESRETRQIIVTTTLIIVIFTILFLGGSTMPLLKVSTPSTYDSVFTTISGALVFCRARMLLAGSVA